MIEWISGNTATLIICTLIAAAVVVVIIKMVKDKKNGKFSCGGNCGNCSMGGCCHKEKESYNSEKD